MSQIDKDCGATISVPTEELVGFIIIDDCFIIPYSLVIPTATSVEHIEDKGE